MIGIKQTLVICLLVSASLATMAPLRSARKPSTHRAANAPTSKVLAKPAPAAEFKLQAIVTLTKLRAVLKENKRVAVYISGDWAGGKLGINTLKDLAGKYPGVRFLHVPLESDEDILNEYPVDNFPAFLFFNEQELVDSVEGNNLVTIGQKFSATFSS